MFSIMAAGCRGACKTLAPADHITPTLSRTLLGAALLCFISGAFWGLIMDLTDEGHARLSAAASSSCLHQFVFLRTCGDGCGGRERSLGAALVFCASFPLWHVPDVKGPASQRWIFGFGCRPAAS